MLGIIGQALIAISCIGGLALVIFLFWCIFRTNYPYSRIEYERNFQKWQADELTKMGVKP